MPGTGLLLDGCRPLPLFRLWADVGECLNGVNEINFRGCPAIRAISEDVQMMIGGSV